MAGEPIEPTKENALYWPREVSCPPSWIEKTAGVCGGEARVRNTRHTVAGLVEWRKLGLSEMRILEHHPDLTAADLQAAWAYYDKNREEIDRAIRENDEA